MCRQSPPLCAAHLLWPSSWFAGSFIKAALWVVRSPRGRLFHVEFRASVVVVREQGRVLRLVKLHASPFEAEGLHVSLRRGSTYLGHLCVVQTALWRTQAESSWSHPHTGVLRLSLRIQPRRSVALGRVAPHGILGQTYDGDAKPIFGREDDYTRKSSEFRTVAQGEGGIEGSVEEYRMASNFGTQFRYSRFDRTAAPPRNTMLLRQRSGGNKTSTPGVAAVRFCPNLNLQGGDIRSAGRRDAPSALACYLSCKQNSRCSAFTYITAPKVARPCWLKRLAEIKRQHGDGVVSGIVRGALVGSSSCNFSEHRSIRDRP